MSFVVTNWFKKVTSEICHFPTTFAERMRFYLYLRNVIHVVNCSNLLLYIVIFDTGYPLNGF